MADAHLLSAGEFTGGGYRVQGQGPDLVLVHGFPFTGKIWDGLLGWLAPHFRVILPDLPGCGLSLNLQPRSMEGMADFLQAVLESAGSVRSVLVGHSMGGYITLAFAEKYPSRLEGIGLVHSYGLADSEEKVRAREKTISLIGQMGSGPWAGGMIPGLFTPAFLDSHRALADSLVEQASRIPPLILQEYTQAMMARPDRSDTLARATVPVLFIAGAADPLLPLASVESQAELARVSIRHFLPGSAHMSFLETPEPVSQAIAEFAEFCFLHSFR